MWLQLHHLPLGMINRPREKIGKFINEVLNVDVDQDDLGWGLYIKVKTWVDIPRPILRGSLLNFEGTPP